MVGRLFSVMLVKNPTTEAMRQNDEQSVIVAGPIHVIARDQNTASAKAGAEFSKDHEIGDLHEIVMAEGC